MNQISEFVKFSKARTIKLIRNKLTDNGVEKIIPTLSNAQILNLSQNNLTEAVLDIIIKHRYGHLSGLKNLILSQNKII
jgi:Leucine-rich repeat (LRR) protein